MKIAICSLSSFSYIATFVDVAERLHQTHEVCYFLGFHCSRSIQLLQFRRLPYQVLLNPTIKIDSVLISPEVASQTDVLFEQYFIKYAELVLPRLIQSLQNWQPDVILSYLRDYAGITAAEILDKPVVSFGPYLSPARVEGMDPPFGTAIGKDAPRRWQTLMWRQHYAFERKISQLYNQSIRQPYSLPDIFGVSTLHSKLLTILEMLPSLSNQYSPTPAYIQYVGLLRSETSLRPSEDELAVLERIRTAPHPRIFLCLGLSYAKRVLGPCLQALAAFPGTVIASLSHQSDLQFQSWLDQANIISHPFFQDMDAVIRLSDAVVSVGAGKTVLRCLALGKPLICLPQRGEQWEIAVALQAAGVAEIPCPRKWDVQRFVEVVEQVSTGSQYSNAAARLRTEIEQSRGVEVAVEAIEALLFSNQ